MFEDVPERLTNAVRELPDDVKADRNLLRAYGAGLIFVEYVRRNPFSEPRRPSLLPKPEGGSDFRHTARLAHIAQDLFSLRNTAAFSEICRRLRTREVHTTAHELHAARTFWSAGYGISVTPELGQIGSDFDFAATRWATVINVEVTALRPTAFSGDKLSNILSHKRQQIPDDRPAVIWCVIPDAWTQGVPGIQVEAQRAAYRALGASGRLNAIVYLYEVFQPIDSSGVGITAYIQFPYYNRKPRLHTNLSFLEKPGNGSYWRTDGVAYWVIDKDAMYTEFEKWLDHCLKLGPP